MNSSTSMRISAMVIVGLYTAFMIFAYDRDTWGLPGLVFISFAILVATGIIFLAWKRPLAGGLVVLFLALLYFLVGAYQWILIYGANSGTFLVIGLIVVSPLLLAGVLLLASHRAMVRSARARKSYSADQNQFPSP